MHTQRPCCTIHPEKQRKWGTTCTWQHLLFVDLLYHYSISVIKKKCINWEKANWLLIHWWLVRYAKRKKIPHNPLQSQNIREQNLQTGSWRCQTLEGDVEFKSKVAASVSVVFPLCWSLPKRHTHTHAGTKPLTGILLFSRLKSGETWSPDLWPHSRNYWEDWEQHVTSILLSPAALTLQGLPSTHSHQPNFGSTEQFWDVKSAGKFQLFCSQQSCCWKVWFVWSDQKQANSTCKCRNGKTTSLQPLSAPLGNHQTDPTCSCSLSVKSAARVQHFHCLGLTQGGGTIPLTL